MMKLRIFCVLAVTAICLAMATSALADAQADYTAEVMADNPFVYLPLDETSGGGDVLNGVVAVNVGSTGVGGTYTVGAGGGFANVNSPLGMGKDFNPIGLSYDATIQGLVQGAAYGAVQSFTTDFLVNM